LKTFLELPNGIPSHDTFSRVLQLLDPRRFHDCSVKWVQALHGLTQGQVVPIDGKTLRRSFASDSERSLPWPSRQDHHVPVRLLIPDAAWLARPLFGIRSHHPTVTGRAVFCLET
jgi:hypothetical protein